MRSSNLKLSRFFILLICLLCSKGILADTDFPSNEDQKQSEEKPDKPLIPSEDNNSLNPSSPDPWIMMDFGWGIIDGRHRMIRGHTSVTGMAGYRWNDTGVFLHISYDRYFDVIGSQRSFKVGQAGIGADRLWFQERVRGTIAAGTSILLTDTAIDDRGSVGFFISLRPASFRWLFGNRWYLELSPLAYDLSVPVLTGIPLTLANFSTIIALEFKPRGHLP